VKGRYCYSFPKGKINEKENELVCAVREVWEETGLLVNDKISEKVSELL